MKNDGNTSRVQESPIKECPGYFVSSDGKVYSTKRGNKRELKGSVWQGYLKVGLSNGKKGSKTKAVHRLVAETFLTKPRGCNVVNHKDGNKLNNHVDNLEWTNHRGNSKHYAKELAPAQAAKKQAQKQEDREARLLVLDLADKKLTDPVTFQNVYRAMFQD